MHHYQKEGPFCWSIMLKVIKAGKKYDDVLGADPIDNSVVMKWLEEILCNIRTPNKKWQIYKLLSLVYDRYQYIGR